MRKRIFKFLFIFALFFGFTTILASCNKQDNNPPQTEGDPQGNTEGDPQGQKDPQPSNVLTELPEDFYENLISFDGIESIKIAIDDLKIGGMEIEKDSFINVAIVDDVIVANGHVKSKTEDGSVDYMFSLDKEEMIAYSKEERKPELDDAVFEETEPKKVTDTNQINIIYRKITLSKETILKIISTFLSGEIPTGFGLPNESLVPVYEDEVEVEELTPETDIELPTIDIDFSEIISPIISLIKPIFVKVASTVLGLTFNYSFSENKIAANISYSLISMVNNIIKGTTAKSIVGEKFDSFKELFNPENENRLTKLTFDQIIRTFNITPEKVDKVVDAIIKLIPTLKEAGVKIPDMLASINSNSTFTSMLLFIIVGSNLVSYTDISAETIAAVTDNTLTMGKLLTDDAIKALTINDIAGVIYKLIPHETEEAEPVEGEPTTPAATGAEGTEGTDATETEEELDIAPIIYEAIEKFGNYNLYDLIAFAVKEKTAEEIEEMVDDFIDDLKNTLKLSFTTDNSGYLKTINLEMAFEGKAEGKISVDLSKPYGDDLKKELAKYKDYTAEYKDKTTKNVEALFTDTAFADLEGYSVVKDNENKIIGFKVVETETEDDETINVETTYYFGTAESLGVDESSVYTTKKYLFETYFEILIGTKVEVKIDGEVDDSTETSSISLIYDTATQKFVVFEYEKVSTEGEGTCESPIVDKYQNKKVSFDVYYMVTYTPHTIEKYEYGKTNDGKYNIYAVCSECKEKLPLLENQSEYVNIQTEFIKVDEEEHVVFGKNYYIVKNIVTYSIWDSEEDKLAKEAYASYLPERDGLKSIGFERTFIDDNDQEHTYTIIYIDPFDNPETTPTFDDPEWTKDEAKGVIVVENGEVIKRLGTAVIVA